MRIEPIPCLDDNYAYLVEDPASQSSLIVDASEASPVLSALQNSSSRPTAVLSTHHHPDHVGGNRELLAHNPALRFYGHASDRGRIPAQTDFLEHDQQFRIGSLPVRTLHIPGHTRGAVAYLIGDAVFTGDTLFMAGCGRLFEGTPEMMFGSLNQVLKPLGPQIRIFCGHEYTVANLRFAASVEPDNERVTARLAQTEKLRANDQPTVGATMAEEIATNPFLRCASPTIRQTLKLGATATELEIFTALRKTKDSFRAS